MGSDHNLHGFYNSTGLELGLGSYEYQPDQDHDQEINKKRSLITMSLKCDHLLPSDLTLGPISSSSDHHQSSPVSTEKSADTILHRQASSLSAVSSFSNSSASTTVVKRDREVISGEVEVETNLERSLVSPRMISGSISDVNNQIIEDDSVLDQGSPRKKLRLTKQQSALLEDSFKEHTTLNPKQKQDLAKQLNLRPRQVEVWFQNRRARTKLKQTEADYEQWKKCCEALTEENKRLQKELQELKSLKLITAPFYMQYPTPASAAPATLTICPSCERLGRGGGGDSSGRVLIRPKATHLISNSYTTTTQHPSEAAC